MDSHLSGVLLQSKWQVTAPPFDAASICCVVALVVVVLLPTLVAVFGSR